MSINISNARRRRNRVVGNVLLGSVPFVALLTLWSLASSLNLVASYALPSPSRVASRAIELFGQSAIYVDLAASLLRILAGSIVGILLALPLGYIIATSPRAAEFIEPPLNFFQSVAGIAWVPLAVIWFGFGIGAIIFVVANAVFFLVLFNTIIGAQQIPSNLRMAAKTLGASSIQILTSIIIPGSLPSVVAGIRLGVSFGWRAVIAAEIIGSSSGLGFRAWQAQTFFDSATVLVTIGLIGVVWLTIDSVLLRPLEARTIERWGLVSRN